ncbi:hypothetical protein C2G38_2165553 [Gigaspora rosea]|uniref:Uncharacterized protein n=1 Tax=Gigaspora rosea TaxID=44941 RepID=A0A397VX62_9GLOM|nr:hypothetical protein C2G38_2165553 [Gigaspora rosea]
MSATSNSNTYSLLEATKEVIDSVDMQIDSEENEHKRVKLSLEEVLQVLTITHESFTENVEAAKSGETPSTIIPPTMTSPLVTTRTKESENEVKSIMSMKFSPNNPYIEAEQEDSHENNEHMEDIEIEDRRISEVIEKGED